MVVDGWIWRGDVLRLGRSPRPPMNRSRALLISDPYRTAWHALCSFGPRWMMNRGTPDGNSQSVGLEPEKPRPTADTGQV